MSEFKLNKVYTQLMKKEELLKIIKRTYDKEFIVVFLPRSKDNADILIRSKAKELEEKNE